ncbi:MAG: ABC transporter permease subunit [Isosphaeraceae bacterium]
MSPFFILLRKHLTEARWFIGLVAVAVAMLGWLGVYQTREYLAAQKAATDGMARMRGAGMMRVFGGPDFDGSPAALEVARWNFPLIPLLLICWAIARGSLAIAGEIERGTLDIALSRPISRWSYLMAHVAAAAGGLALMLGALLLGNQVGNWYYSIEDAPGPLPILRPCLNMFALGFAAFGYTLLFSSYDVVRWRATLISSSLTVGGIIAYFIANTDELKERWGWLEWLTVFKGYAPVEAAVKAVQLGPNVGALCGVGLAGIAIAYLFFQGRDLPANS